jgi:SAM-dependent methyltransferase
MDRHLASEFKDYFSDEARAYAAFRPRYPEGLFAWLADLAPERRLAWDAGTGSGQAAVGLAAHFERVIATDASAAQLANARPHPRVEYRRAVAGESGIAARSVDLVTVAQALHWFDRPRFYAEVRSVLVPRGVIAAWCYRLQRVDPAVDAVAEHLYRDLLGEWWTPDRRLVDEEYRTVEFPFEELTPVRFDLSAVWTLPQVLGYLGTWSAVRRCRAETGRNVVEEIGPALAAAWGDPDRPREVRWPLAMRVGRVFDSVT